MKGFIATHKPSNFGSKLHFVDEIFVKREFRRKGFATALMNVFSNGPLELRVHSDNHNAIALYTKLGFVEIHSDADGPSPNFKRTRCTYPETKDSDYLCMRTKNYIVTKARIAKLLEKKKTRVKIQRFDSYYAIPGRIRNGMIMSTMFAHGYTREQAERNLYHNSPGDMKYAIIL